MRLFGKIEFCIQKLYLSNHTIVFLVSVVVAGEMNRSRYFQNTPHIELEKYSEEILRAMVELESNKYVKNLLKK